MTDEGLEYFPNWFRAERALSELADLCFRPHCRIVTPSGSQSPPVVDVRVAFVYGWRVFNYVPDEYVSVYLIVHNDFVRDVITTSGGLESVLSDLIDRYPTDEGKTITLSRLSQDLNVTLVNWLRDHYGELKLINAFKGWLGIEPYRANVPQSVRRRLTGTLVMTSLNGRLRDQDDRVRVFYEDYGVPIHLNTTVRIERGETTP